MRNNWLLSNFSKALEALVINFFIARWQNVRKIRLILLFIFIGLHHNWNRFNARYTKHVRIHNTDLQWLSTGSGLEESKRAMCWDLMDPIKGLEYTVTSSVGLHQEAEGALLEPRRGHPMWRQRLVVLWVNRSEPSTLCLFYSIQPTGKPMRSFSLLQIFSATPETCGSNLVGLFIQVDNISYLLCHG